MIIKFHGFHVRVWNHSTCSWTTVTSDRFEDQHGIVYFITLDREANIQFVKRKKNEPLNKDLRYVPFPVVTTQITDTVEAEVLENARSVAGKS